MFTKKDVPKYIQKEIANGNLVQPDKMAKIDCIPGFDCIYTFRLFTVNGDEEHAARGIDETIKLAECIVKYCNNKLQGTAKVGRTGVSYEHKTYNTRYSIQHMIEYSEFVVIGITDPFNRIFEGMMEGVDSPHKRATVWEDPCLLSECDFEISEVGLLGYIRMDHDKSLNWWSTWNGQDMSQLKYREEIEAVDDLIRVSFPYGVMDIEKYCHNNHAEQLSGEEYNMYYKSEHYHFWIRFRCASCHGDYCCYVYVYNNEKEASLKRIFCVGDSFQWTDWFTGGSHTHSITNRDGEEILCTSLYDEPDGTHTVKNTFIVERDDNGEERILVQEYKGEKGYIYAKDINKN